MNTIVRQAVRQPQPPYPLQNRPEQSLGHGDLRHLEDDVSRMRNNLRPDLPAGRQVLISFSRSPGAPGSATSASPNAATPADAGRCAGQVGEEGHIRSQKQELPSGMATPGDKTPKTHSVFGVLSPAGFVKGGRGPEKGRLGGLPPRGAGPARRPSGGPRSSCGLRYARRGPGRREGGSGGKRPPRPRAGPALPLSARRGVSPASYAAGERLGPTGSGRPARASMAPAPPGQR